MKERCSQVTPAESSASAMALGKGRSRGCETGKAASTVATEWPRLMRERSLSHSSISSKRKKDRIKNLSYCNSLKKSIQATITDRWGAAGELCRGRWRLQPLTISGPLEVGSPHNVPPAGCGEVHSSTHERFLPKQLHLNLIKPVDLTSHFLEA